MLIYSFVYVLLCIEMTLREKSIKDNCLKPLARISTSLYNVICHRLLVVKQNYYMMNLNTIHNPVFHTVIKKYEKSSLTGI